MHSAAVHPTDNKQALRDVVEMARGTNHLDRDCFRAFDSTQMNFIQKDPFPTACGKSGNI